MRSLIFAIFLGIFTLTGCTSFSNSHTTQDFLKETWMRNVNLDARIWTRGADRWFFTGESREQAANTVNVKVSQFTHLELSGCFKVQMIGIHGANHLAILGANEEIRQLNVQVSNNTVSIRQLPDKNGKITRLQTIIVQIAMENLQHLQVDGGVHIEGRGMLSTHLVIDSANSDCILLSGDVRLTRVKHVGNGTISVLCTYTPCLDIVVRNAGTVNVSGRVGIHSIYNTGGAINIIGADSRWLTVCATEKGVTKIAGYVNLKKLVVAGDSCVYIYWVNSNGAYVVLRDNARVGLAGSVNHVDMNLSGNARLGAQYLHGDEVYVQTHNNAHANVAAKRKMFASAMNSSSIYYFGAPGIVTSYASVKGSILHVWGNTNALPVPPMIPVFTNYPKFGS